MKRHDLSYRTVAWLGITALSGLVALPGSAQEHAHDQGTQEDHRHAHGDEGASGHMQAKGPHGGQLTRTSAFNVEGVFLADGIRLYVYDHEQSPVDPGGVSGTVTLSGDDSEGKEIDLEVAKPTEDETAGHLHAAVDLSEVVAGTMTATISLQGLPSRSESEASFQQTVTPTAVAGYACPMHPDVASMNPGECERCGMPLEAANVLYACPMHPEITAAGAASCTRCGMKLELVAQPAADSVEEAHDGGE